MNYPLLQPTKDNRYIVVRDFTYKDITVPKGYKTNGANVPRLLWSWLPPFKPKFMPAVVVHDYLCDLEMYEKADQYFTELLYNTEKSITTRLMSGAVKIYHKIRYRV